MLILLNHRLHVQILHILLQVRVNAHHAQLDQFVPKVRLLRLVLLENCAYHQALQSNYHALQVINAHHRGNKLNAPLASIVE